MCSNKFQSIYIYKVNLRVLSPRQWLNGRSGDFTHEQGRSRARKQSRSDVDCTLLFKVTRENSLSQSQARPGSLQAAAAAAVGLEA